MAATLNDVARSAGVSIRTVTNVLNGQVKVSDSTRKRVLSAIERLDYRPNLAARNLRTGRTGILALVVPDLAAPYFSTLASIVVQEGDDRSYQVIVEQGDLSRGIGQSSRGRKTLADVVMFASDASGEEIQSLQQGALASRLVFLGEYDVAGLFPQVGIDNFAVGYDATRELIGLGCRRIAAVGAESASEFLTPRRRTEGYIAALDESSANPVAYVARPVSEHTRAEGYQVANELFDAHPDVDGVICYSDTLAIGVLAALRDRDVKVPEDVRVIGVDGIEEGRFCTPTLTSVSFDLREMVDSAFRVVKEQSLEPVVLPHKIVHRESTTSTRGQ